MSELLHVWINERVSGTPDATSTNKSTNTDAFCGPQARVICICMHKSTNTDAFGGPQVRGETFKAEFELFEFANEFSSELSHEYGGANGKKIGDAPTDALQVCSAYYFGTCLARSSPPSSSNGDEPIRMD